MDAEDSIAIVVGALGFFTSIGSIVVAVRANKRADQANVIAAGANTIATGANTLSSESNVIAKGANVLAQEANEISRDQAARSAERHDVRWQGEWATIGVFRLTNVGISDALRVRVDVTIDSERQTSDVDLVPAGSHVDLLFPGAAATARSEQRGRAEAERNASRAPFGLGQQWLPSFHSLSEHVAWETAAGSPKTHQNDTRLWPWSDDN